MWGLVNKNYLDPHLRNIAMAIIRNVPGKDYLGEANAIFEYVKRGIVYRRDPEGAEWISDPFVTLNDKLGDCDDHAILVSALSKAVGLPARFVTVKTINPDVYNHVFAGIFVNGKWLAADTTEDKSYLGWHPVAQYGEKIWNDPLSKTTTEGGYDMAGYDMTAGEQLIYRDLTELLASVKSWSLLTSWDKIANDRQKIANTKGSAEKNLSDPKKIDVTTRLQTLWDGYRSKKAEGWSSLQGFYTRGLTRARDILGLPTFEVVRIIKEETGITPPVSNPVAVSTSVIVPPQAPLPEAPEPGKGILGMSKRTAVIIGISAVTVIGGIIYYLKTRE